jgi:hypothetical protein
VSGLTISTSPCTSSATGLLSVAGAIVGRSVVPRFHADDARNASPAGLANWARTNPPGSRISVLGAVVRASKSIPPPASSGM